MRRPIPQCSPLAAYQAQAADIDAAIRDTLEAGRYVLGPRVAGFEASFARWIGVAHGLGVANGTDALELALRALGVGAGDFVVTSSMSAVATAVAIRKAGASPLFADIDPEHGLVDPAGIDALFASHGQRIRALVPVHLYGRCVDMDAIMATARRHGVPVVEDCAQAHGAQWSGRAAGSFGAFGSFSFYPTKNLGAIGDGGALVTDDAELRERARLLREYGWKTRYISDIEGGNSRLDELQAAVLQVKLARLHEDNAARHRIAQVYREGLRHAEIQVFRGDDTGHVYHQFVVLSEARDALQAHLASHEIGSLVHYPAAIHMQPAYASADYAPVPLPNTERWTSRVLSLPMYPQLPLDDARRVVETVNAWRMPRR
ncbi:DegT/DnrJ/EryC1/StrS family aminotransferase [Variovorax arabinosiphilus]|uniref:DegT/DnrJ/EryC1/StrS family aminotransferase n=1 Tax=Variovorax arabinosiphilus TaxID=3053498 RepID=UPI002574D9BB|nr:MULTISPECIES: DegT/DnrJ/EryC1/StrS family aminotransferase [unclassified Variovorax]MDM0121770.1 DegT/DnrJ/EryC1/StrS family aminotransferase [Variovorax sp. J2L1-78]MDM0130831.1 DegT/DnrJ/EryC1/StrS family aminotransferase [Variovorax sp. J2L1-63]MDM0234533.1 DegT/DnrJ/EryC1/StrS family aminotransferase [Variovorax sp. J2R1-6]